MSTERVNARIPRYLSVFIEHYKKAKHIETTTEVIVYALETLKNIYEEEKKGDGSRLKFMPNIPGDTNGIFTPKEKVLKKIENDPKFRKNEYNVVKLLTEEQLKDYTENYQDLGVSLDSYYKAYVRKDV